MKKIAVVLLNFNGADFLKQFLPGIIQHTPFTGAEVDIYIIDNASTDDSLNLLKTDFSSVKVIALDKNYGFAEGYNQGLEDIDADYFLLLNTDVEVTPNWIEPLFKLMESDESIKVCQPKILSWHQKDTFEHSGAAGGFLDFLGYPFCRGRIMDTLEKDTGQYDDTKEVFWATGAALMIRADEFDERVGFAGHFFAHMEEIDLCWRIKNTGGKIFACPESYVYHVGGGALPYNSPRKIYLNFRNNLFLITRNDRSGFTGLKIFTRLILDGLAGLKFLFEGKPKHTGAVLRAHFTFYGRLGQTIKERRALEKLDTHSSRGLRLHEDSIVWAYFVKGKKHFTDL